MKIFLPKFYEKVVRICMGIWCLVFVSKFALNCTDGFAIFAIRPSCSYQDEFETRPLTFSEKQELTSALSQPYRYYGCGGQAYALFSEDDQYVLKFFKKRPLKSNPRLTRDFTSYKLAFEELKDKTGVLYCHLKKSNHLNKKVEIIDRLNIHHTLDLDQFDFLLQRKGDYVYDYISKEYERAGKIAAESAIASLLRLLSDLPKNGYRNRDLNIRTNCGFLEGEAILLDVGKLSKERVSDGMHNKQLLRTCAPFQKWLEESHPDLVDPFQNMLKEKLQK